jgi:branched-chain amino acid transport system permease protein
VAQFLTFVLVGLGLGSLYGLIGLGFMGIYNSTGVLNFAQGDFAMVGAVVPSLLVYQLRWPAVPAVAAGLVTALLLALIMQSVIVNPLLKRGAKIIPLSAATISLSFVIEGALGGFATYGTVPSVNYVNSTPITFGAVTISKEYAVIIVVTFALSALYWFFLQRTFLGSCMRAIGSNTRGAVGIGISVTGTRNLAFMISALIAAISGFLVGPLVAVSVFMGFTLLTNGFVASVVGGMGRPFAPLLGGVVTGVILSLESFYGSASYAELFVLVILLVFLSVRPGGLLGAVGRRS